MAAKEPALFQAKQVYAMKEIALKEQLDCDLVLTRVCEAYISQSQADEMTTIYQELLNDELDYIQDLDYVGPKFAKKVSYQFESLCLANQT